MENRVLTSGMTTLTIPEFRFYRLPKDVQEAILQASGRLAKTTPAGELVFKMPAYMIDDLMGRMRRLTAEKGGA